MMAIFFDFIEDIMKVFMDVFFLWFCVGYDFDHCLNNLSKVLQRCKDMN